MKKVLFLVMAVLLAGCTAETTDIGSSTASWGSLWSDPANNAQKLVADMSIREQIGQVLMLDIRNWQDPATGVAKDVTVLPPPIAQAITDYKLGAIILFRENTVTTEQTHQLLADIQTARYKIPLLVGVDQEGGYVTRLQEGTEMPGNMALGATRNLSMAQGAGYVHGSELNALGFTTNFAPSVDVNVNQNNPVIGVRSYGSDPSLVSEMGNSYISGLHKYKMQATAKHFPGHGNVSTDSHIGLPVVPYSEAEWRQTDLVPFQSVIQNNIDGIMTAHIVFPALDDTKVISKKDGTEIGLPATLSKKILTGILRNELQFKGLIFTDAMNMGAIADNFGTQEAVERALLAGADVILMPVQMNNQDGIAQLESLYQFLEQQAQQNPELKARITESATRVVADKLKHRIPEVNPVSVTEAKTIVASAANKAYEMKVAKAAITLIENQGVLPYPLSSDNNILVISDEPNRNSIVSRELANIASESQTNISVDSAAFNLQSGPLPSDLNSKITNSQFIILVTYNLTQTGSAAQQVIDQANASGKPLVVISSRNPYDIAYLNHVKANIAIYGITGFDVTNNDRNSLEANIKAGIRTIFTSDGNANLFNIPSGKLPVDIRDPDDNIIYPYGTGLTY